jgi:hypothetical protein
MKNQQAFILFFVIRNNEIELKVGERRKFILIFLPSEIKIKI